MPPECPHFHRVVQPPYAHRAVAIIAARDGPSAVGEEGDAPHRIGMVGKGLQQLACGGAPHLGRVIVAARHDALAVHARADAIYIRRMGRECACELKGERFVLDLCCVSDARDGWQCFWLDIECDGGGEFGEQAVSQGGCGGQLCQCPFVVCEWWSGRVASVVREVWRGG